MKAPRWDRNRKGIGGRAGRKNNMGVLELRVGLVGRMTPGGGRRMD